MPGVQYSARIQINIIPYDDIARSTCWLYLHKCIDLDMLTNFDLAAASRTFNVCQMRNLRCWCNTEQYRSPDDPCTL